MQTSALLGFCWQVLRQTGPRSSDWPPGPPPSDCSTPQIGKYACLFQRHFARLETGSQKHLLMILLMMDEEMSFYSLLNFFEKTGNVEKWAQILF